MLGRALLGHSERLSVCLHMKIHNIQSVNPLSVASEDDYIQTMYDATFSCARGPTGGRCTPRCVRRLLVLMMINPCTILKEGRDWRWDTIKVTTARVETQNHFSLTEKCRSFRANAGCPSLLHVGPWHDGALPFLDFLTMMITYPFNLRLHYVGG